MFQAIERLPSLLRRMSADLEGAAADFLSGDRRRFRAVRAALAASRSPHTIWSPAEKGQYLPSQDPESTALRARYAAEAEPDGGADHLPRDT